MKAQTLPCQKGLFSIPDDVHFINCAYMGPIARAVEEAGVEALRLKGFPARISPADFFTTSDEARRRFAGLINVPEPQRIALVPSTGFAVATVAKNLKPKAGQNIVVLFEQFPSNVYAWRNFRKQGVEIRTVEPPASGERGKEWNTRLLEAIDPNTALVTVENVHWSDGTKFDLEAVGQRAREVGAMFVVDGIQSIGAMPFDQQRVKADAVICLGYKWLLAGYSFGFAYFGERFDQGEPLEESWIARKGSQDFARLVDYQDEYQPGALRYDFGERSNQVALAMVNTSLQMLAGWGVENIQAYCAELTREFNQAVRELGYTLEDERYRSAHLFGIRPPKGTDLEALRQRLAERKVYVSVRGSAVRIGAHVYNDHHDMEALLDALR